jgi:mitogen-activated protein kinase kinase
MADAAFAPRSMKRKNVKGLALKAPAPKPPPTAENARMGPANGKNDDKDNQLEIGIEFNLDLKPEDLEIIKDLGAGNGGTVSKVKHIPTNTVMARKVGSLIPPPPSWLLSASSHRDTRLSTSKRKRRCAGA